MPNFLSSSDLAQGPTVLKLPEGDQVVGGAYPDVPVGWPNGGVPFGQAKLGPAVGPAPVAPKAPAPGPVPGRPVAGGFVWGGGRAGAQAGAQATSSMRLTETVVTVPGAAAAQSVAPGVTYPATIIDQELLRQRDDAIERAWKTQQELDRVKRSVDVESREAIRLKALEDQLARAGGLSGFVGQTPADAAACVKYLVRSGIPKDKAIRMCVKALARKRAMVKAIPTALDYFHY